MTVADLPALNASLNATSGALLVAGWVMIKTGRVAAHRACMGAAFLVSTLFLVSYLIYHARVGSVPYTGTGALRVVYFVILITHIVLAAAVVPLATVTIVLALKERFQTHRRVARWTFPIWLYVSVTGVVVYLMLY